MGTNTALSCEILTAIQRSYLGAQYTPANTSTTHRRERGSRQQLQGHADPRSSRSRGEARNAEGPRRSRSAEAKETGAVTKKDADYTL